MRTATLKSSALKSAAHDGADTLTIEHTDGSTYAYRGVSVDVFDALVDAPSVGRFYNTSIRNVFDATRR